MAAMASSKSFKIPCLLLSLLLATGVHSQVTFSRGWLSGGKRDPALEQEVQSVLPYHLMGGGSLTGYPQTQSQVAVANRLLNAMRVSAHSGELHGLGAAEDEDWKARFQQAFAAGQLSLDGENSENRLGSASLERLRLKPPLWTAFRRHLFPLSRGSILPNRQTRRDPQQNPNLQADDDVESDQASLQADARFRRSQLNKEDAEKSALHFKKPTDTEFYTIWPSAFYPYFPGKFGLFTTAASIKSANKNGWKVQRSVRLSNNDVDGHSDLASEAAGEDSSNSSSAI